MENQEAAERLYILEKKADDLTRYLVGDKNNPFDKGALGNLEEVRKRLHDLITIADHNALIKQIDEIRNCVNVVEDKIEKLEKVQIKYSVMTIAMWTAFGTIAGLIAAYFISLIKH